MSRLELTPVGVGTSYSAYGIAQTGFLVRAGSRTVLFDLGSGVMNRLQRHIDPADLDLIAISHVHPDHCVDLFPLRVYMAWGPGAGRRIPVLGPPALRELLVGFGGEAAWDDAFSFAALARPSGVRDLGDGLRLSWREVPHHPPTYALRLDWNGSSVCFGADCGPNDVLAEFAAGVDVLVLECSFGTERSAAGVPHLNAEEVGRIAARAAPGRLLITHCYPEHDEGEVLAAVGRHHGGPVAFARQDEAVPA